MQIRKLQEGDFKKLIPIYKKFFPVHAVFTKSDEEIMQHLDKMKQRGEFLVAEDEGKIKGGLVIVKRTIDAHTTAELKRIAAKTPVRKVMAELIKAAEEEVVEGKIEIMVAESEKVKPSFFKKLGYKVEGKLRSHYRSGEMCYILGKEVEQNAGE
jgi:N-acetylglutamate synthase-like GNAT family acetyltransferase